MIQTKLIGTDLSSKVQLRFESLIKGTVAQATDLRHYPHSVCDILVFASAQLRGDLKRAISRGSVESQLLYPSAVYCLRPNTYKNGRMELPDKWTNGVFYQATRHWEYLGLPGYNTDYDFCSNAAP